MKQYGEFKKEDGGRMSGHILRVGNKRKDGKFPVSHHFATSGKTIKKLYTEEQLREQIEKVSKQP